MDHIIIASQYVKALTVIESTKGGFPDSSPLLHDSEKLHDKQAGRKKTL